MMDLNAHVDVSQFLNMLRKPVNGLQLGNELQDIELHPGQPGPYFRRHQNLWKEIRELIHLMQNI